MAEQFEFTKLSEVPIVETASEEANVLLEENGTIRRVPKTEVGGSGMLIVNVTANTADAAISMADVKAKTGSEPEFIADKTYDEITEAINRGENVVVKGNVYGIVFILPLVQILHELDSYLAEYQFTAIMYSEGDLCSLAVTISSDNSVVLETDSIDVIG